MKFYDLFSGIGGFRIGLEAAGHQCVGSCEIDKHARTIYERHFGEKPELDALKLDAGAMPDFDILAAGFPCQAFSLAGKRLGFEDTRGTLFFEIARIARQKRPRYLLLENVEGLLFHDEGRTFGTILLALDELGYDVEWQVFHGSDFLPQRRERVFIVGHSRDQPTPQIFPLGDAKKTVIERASTHAIDANYWKGIDNHAQRTCLAMLTPDREEKRQNGRRFKTNGEPMFTITSTDRHGVAIPIRDARFSKGTALGRRFKTDGEPAFTVKAFVTQGIQTDFDMRVLTPLECERLQGFPDLWTEGIPERQRYHCLGNAVMPPVVEYIAKHLIAS